MTAHSQPIRVMTYNVHSCRGMDRMISTGRIAEVIASHKPDIVNLQELDLRPRAGGLDQPDLISKKLAMLYHFHSPIHHREGKFGNAILTRFPIRLIAAGKLPGVLGKEHWEARGAIWCEVNVNGRHVQCINTHLGLRRRERMKQVEELIGDRWMRHGMCRPPIIMCGDLNASHQSKECAVLCKTLHDVQDLVKTKHQATWSSRFPFRRLDHIFVSKGVEVVKVAVPKSRLERMASDHLPVIVDCVI